MHGNAGLASPAARTREEDSIKTSEGSPGSSWLVSLFALLVVAQPPLAMLASALFDDIYTVVDSSWRVVTVVEGNAARNVQVLAMVLLAGLSVHLILTALRRPPVVASILAVAATVGIGSELLRGPDASQALGMGTYLLAIWAAAVSVPRHQALRWVGWAAVVFWLTNWLLYLAGDPSAGKECRDDKCSYLGSLMVGYTQHEQTLGLYSALLLPAVAFVPRPFRWPALALGTATLLATGSRTALAAGALGLLACWLLAPLRGQGEDRWEVRRGGVMRPFLGLIPLVALLAALALFLLAPPQALTGRGQVWHVVRRSLVDHPWFGPGRDSLEHGYGVGDLDFVAWTEHNQAGYVLAAGGVVMLLLFLAGLLQLGLRALRPDGLPAAVVLLPAALGLATEVVWSVNLLSGSTTWTLLLAVLLTPKGPLHGPPPQVSAWKAARARLRRHRSVLVGSALLAGLASMALAGLTPKSYQATSEVFTTTTAGDLDGLSSSVEITQLRARTYARLVTSAGVAGAAWEDVGLSGTDAPQGLRVEVPNDTTILRITARAATPQTASELAAAVARRASERLPQLEPGLVAVPLTAGPPSAEQSPHSYPKAAIGGAVVGLLLALPRIVRRTGAPAGQQPRPLS